MSQADFPVFFWTGFLILVIVYFALCSRKCKVCGKRGHYGSEHCSKHQSFLVQKFIGCPACFFEAEREKQRRADLNHDNDLESIAEKVIEKLEKRQSIKREQNES